MAVDTGPRIGSYLWYRRAPWHRGREAALSWGARTGPTVAIALPLLEEANRTRAFAAAILRALAVRGIGGVLADLPGQGESPVPTESMVLTDLRAAFSRLWYTHAVAIRSGALAISSDRPRWLLAPQVGQSVLQEWARIERAPLTGSPVRVAGNRLSPVLLRELCGALPPLHATKPTDVRVVRLSGDRRPADHRIDGAPPWRRAEPSNDPALAETLAADIADWIASCES